MLRHLSRHFRRNYITRLLSCLNCEEWDFFVVEGQFCTRSMEGGFIHRAVFTDYPLSVSLMHCPLRGFIQNAQTFPDFFLDIDIQGSNDVLLQGWKVWEHLQVPNSYISKQ